MNPFLVPIFGKLNEDPETADTSKILKYISYFFYGIYPVLFIFTIILNFYSLDRILIYYLATHFSAFLSTIYSFYVRGNLRVQFHKAKVIVEAKDILKRKNYKIEDIERFVFYIKYFISRLSKIKCEITCKAAIENLILDIPPMLEELSRIQDEKEFSKSIKKIISRIRVNLKIVIKMQEKKNNNKNIDNFISWALLFLRDLSKIMKNIEKLNIKRISSRIHSSLEKLPKIQEEKYNSDDKEYEEKFEQKYYYNKLTNYFKIPWYLIAFGLAIFDFFIAWSGKFYMGYFAERFPSFKPPSAFNLVDIANTVIEGLFYAYSTFIISIMCIEFLIFISRFRILGNKNFPLNENFNIYNAVLPNYVGGYIVRFSIIPFLTTSVVAIIGLFYLTLFQDDFIGYGWVSLGLVVFIVFLYAVLKGAWNIHISQRNYIHTFKEDLSKIVDIEIEKFPKKLEEGKNNTEPSEQNETQDNFNFDRLDNAFYILKNMEKFSTWPFNLESMKSLIILISTSIIPFFLVIIQALF